jgi:hypothetical protein
MAATSEIPVPNKNSKKLLCLDGGGVKGISSLIILNAIMERVKEFEGKAPNPTQHFPHTCFDLAGGTSTGGLAALMMFRLGMSTQQTMKSYDEMSKEIFPRSWATKFRTPFSSMYPAWGLEKAIERVVGNALGTCGDATRRTLLLGQPPVASGFAPARLSKMSVLFQMYEPENRNLLILG